VRGDAVQQVAEAGGGDPDQLRWLIVLVAALAVELPSLFDGGWGMGGPR
jgi:hypothetical protein